MLESSFRGYICFCGEGVTVEQSPVTGSYAVSEVFTRLYCTLAAGNCNGNAEALKNALDTLRNPRATLQAVQDACSAPAVRNLFTA